MRTTIDIDSPILKKIKQLQRLEKKSLGRIVSDLLALALERHQYHSDSPPPFLWTSQAMGAQVDLADTDAIYAALDRR